MALIAKNVTPIEVFEEFASSLALHCEPRAKVAVAAVCSPDEGLVVEVDGAVTLPEVDAFFANQ